MLHFPSTVCVGQAPIARDVCRTLIHAATAVEKSMEKVLFLVLVLGLYNAITGQGEREVVDTDRGEVYVSIWYYESCK